MVLNDPHISNAFFALLLVLWEPWCLLKLLLELQQVHILSCLDLSCMLYTDRFGFGRFGVSRCFHCLFSMFSLCFHGVSTCCIQWFLLHNDTFYVFFFFLVLQCRLESALVLSSTIRSSCIMGVQSGQFPVRSQDATRDGTQDTGMVLHLQFAAHCSMVYTESTPSLPSVYTVYFSFWGTRACHPSAKKSNHVKYIFKQFNAIQAMSRRWLSNLQTLQPRRAEQAELWRDDVRDIIGLTQRKMAETLAEENHLQKKSSATEQFESLEPRTAIWLCPHFFLECV